MKFNTIKNILILAIIFIVTISHVQAAPGDLDPSFGNGGRVSSPGFFGNAIALQSDGKIVAVGNGIERYNSDGSLDASFGTGGRVVLHSSVVPGCRDYYGNHCDFSPSGSAAVAIQPDGKIIAAGSGSIYSFDGMFIVWVFALTRYDTDGSLDASFGTAGRVVTYGSGAEGGPHAIAIQSDDKIVAAGYKRVASWDFLTARYNTNGTLDASFGSGGLVTTSFGGIADEANDIAIQSDGKIVVAGQNRMGVFQGPVIFNFALAKYNPNGSLDTTFGSGGKVATPFDYNFGAEAIAIQSDGKIVAVGTSGIDYTYHTFALARYNTNGSLDNSFGTGGKVLTPFGNVNGSGVRDVEIQSDGKIIAAGGASDGTNSGVALARYNPDSSLDTSFGTGGKVITPSLTGAVNAAIQPDDKIIVVTQPERFVTGSEYALLRYKVQAEASFTVTRSDDRNNAACVPGDCSLREAVSAANASGGDDTINFAPGLTTITLINNEIVINNAGTLTINGTGANILTIDGGAGTNRIFYTNQATVTISGVTLTGGNGTGGGISGNGGAINAAGGLLTLDSVYVTGNTAIGYGGGVFNFLGNSNIINSIISDNTAGEGGGIGNILGSLTIVNSTIASNTSTYSGGGIYTDSGNATLRNVTITNNTAQIGGGIYNNRSEYPVPALLNFGNTIVAGNNATTGIAPEIWSHNISPVTSAGGNLAGDSPGDSANIPIVYQPTDIRDTNPLLGALQNNGGSTPTHALLAGSPVIDRGLNTLVSPLASAFDQRGTGFPRIVDGNGDGTATVDIGAFEVQSVNVANLEELYSAVNNPQNAGMLIIIAPGVYMLSVNDPNGAARPNSGRIELQENMSLHGVAGDRAAVVIDAINLPRSSFDNAPPINLTGAIRMGRGSNSIEWLTVRNAVNGNTNIGTDLVSNGMVHIRVAHVATSNSQRGIDVRNVGEAMAGRFIEAEIVDNDIFNNRIGAQGEALRIVNNAGADGGVVSATLSGNRSYNNFLGLIVENNGASLANVSVTSSGDRFFENGLGALVGAALTQADGNTVNFTATGTSFENNNGLNNFDRGGLLIIGGENLLIPNGTSDNTVNVVLRGCRLANNQLYDLTAIGARSNPPSIGCPGTNNRVKIRLYSTLIVNLVAVDSIPDCPGGMNSVTITRTTPFDFDGDGKTDLSVFRPSDRIWYFNLSQVGFSAMQFGLSTDKITPADFDGDGKTDIAVYRDGVWWLLNSSDGTVSAVNFGLAGDIPVPADYTGDGRAELAVYRGGTWYSFNLANNQVNTIQFGLSTDKPVVADYDGDGRADQAVYRGSGEWHLNQSSQGYAVVQFGLATDKPVVGDYDADGKTDLAVYRDGTWYVLQSTNGFTAFQFGLATDIPAPADYDGDGKTDAAIYRNGQWWLRQSTSGVAVQQFGLANDKPIPSAYMP